MKTIEYMKKNKISYNKISKVINMDVAYVYRVLSRKGNSATKLVKPSEMFLAKLKSNFPGLYVVFLEETSDLQCADHIS